MEINRFVFWTISFVVCIASSCLIVPSIDQVVSNPDYVAAKMSNFDGPGMQTLIGAMMLAFVSAVFHTILHIGFLTASFTSLRSKQIHVMDFLIQKDKRLLNIIRSIGFLLMVIFLCVSSQDFMFTKDFFKTYALYILCDVAVLLGILCYIIWFVTLFKNLSKKALIALTGIVFIGVCPILLLGL